MTPAVKAFATDIGCEIASLCVQVHGGMGFDEETGVAQIFRDIRIAPIYEGTNAIQAIDLVTRKIGRDKGEDLARLIAECRADVAAAERILGLSAANMRLFGLALGGALLCRGAAAAGEGEGHWPRMARVYADDIAIEAQSLSAQILVSHRNIADYHALAGLG